MGYTTLQGAMSALMDDERWQGPLTIEEKRLCLEISELKLHQALDLAFTGMRARLVSIGQTLPRIAQAQRMDMLKAMLE